MAASGPTPDIAPPRRGRRTAPVVVQHTPDRIGIATVEMNDLSIEEGARRYALATARQAARD